jgi:hypothetical protein
MSWLYKTIGVRRVLQPTATPQPLSKCGRISYHHLIMWMEITYFIIIRVDHAIERLMHGIFRITLIYGHIGHIARRIGGQIRSHICPTYEYLLVSILFFVTIWFRSLCVELTHPRIISSTVVYLLVTAHWLLWLNQSLLLCMLSNTIFELLSSLHFKLFFEYPYLDIIVCV